MARRQYDPFHLTMEAAAVNWTAIGRSRGDFAAVEAAAKKRGISTSQVQLRWLMAPVSGMPDEPFTVWARRSGSPGGQREWQPVTMVAQNALVCFLPEACAAVRLRIATAGGCAVVAYSGTPFESHAVDLVTLASAGSIVLTGACIGSIVIHNGSIDGQAVLYPGRAVALDEAWQPVERVGLPAIEGEIPGFAYAQHKQGLVSAMTDPFQAALDRYNRAAPLAGWFPAIGASGSAPDWVPAEPEALIKALHIEVLPSLAQAMGSLAPDQQHLMPLQQVVPVEGGGRTATLNYGPLTALGIGAVSDPQFSIAAGFGTAYALGQSPLGREAEPPPVVVAASAAPGFDFMVTANYRAGFDGRGEPLEIAALALFPKRRPPPGLPSGLDAWSDGVNGPDATDLAWRDVARIGWDRIPDRAPFRPASYAAARIGQAPPRPVVALLLPRRFDERALQPISATTSRANEAATGQITAADDSNELAAAPAPNLLTYAVSQQDIFGQWSDWSTTQHAVAEPAVEGLRLLTARLDAVAPAGGSVCDGVLTVEFTWDWRARSLGRVEIAGSLAAAARPGQPAPPVPGMGAGLQQTFPGGGFAGFTLDFAGQGAPVLPPGVVLTHLSANGAQVLPAPATDAAPRRYRLRIPGFRLTFPPSGWIMLALWARGREHAAPQRLGAWSGAPLVVTAADPRPPLLIDSYEDVERASLADSRGEHHLRLNWSAMDGAQGYVIYSVTESRLRDHAGLPAPSAGMTLRQRLKALRELLRDLGDIRTPFTRLDSAPTALLARGCVIPRGSRDIHLYLVLGLGAGGIESPWPFGEGRELRFRAFAAPQVVEPGAPVLEVRREAVMAGGATLWRARLLVRSRPGAGVARLDLHRVRRPEGALALDSMGPPIARISGSGGGWTVAPLPAEGGAVAQPIGTVTGLDAPVAAPALAWDPVFYRAVAWAADDPERGLIGGRSAPSAAAAVVIPPDGPPPLEPLTATWPGGAPELVRIATASAAPVAAGELGAHRMQLEAYALPPGGGARLLASWPPLGADGSLAAIPASAPVGALSRSDAAGGSSYAITLQRDDVNDALRLIWLLTDPLGRTTERMIEHPGGHPLPMPEIEWARPVAVQGGLLLALRTNAPVQPTPQGAYTFAIRLAGGQRRSLPIGEIPTVRRLENPLAGAEPIPLRRGGPAAGVLTIAIYLRAAGMPTVTIAAPDGRQATSTPRP
jgi:hypothetical protein